VLAYVATAGEILFTHHPDPAPPIWACRGSPLITVHFHMPLTLEAHSAPSDPTVGSDAKVSHFMKDDRWADHLPMGVLVTNTTPNVKSGRR